MHIRLRVAAQALNAGYNVLLSDADAVFISPVILPPSICMPRIRVQAPLASVPKLLSSIGPDFVNSQVLPLVNAAMFPNAEEVASYDDEPAELRGDQGGVGAVDLAVSVDAPDGGGADGVMVMAGFWAARRCAGGGSSTEARSKACRFLSDVLTRCKTATEDAHDQHSFNIVLSQYAKRRLISFAFLDTTKFMNGAFFRPTFVDHGFPFVSHAIQGRPTLLTCSTCAGGRRGRTVPWQWSKTTGLQELEASCSAFAGMACGSWIRNLICRCVQMRSLSRRRCGFWSTLCAPPLVRNRYWRCAYARMLLTQKLGC